MNQRLTILAASQSGTAFHVAEAFKERLDQTGRFEVTLIEEDDMPDLSFADTDILLLVIATHGEGEMPEPFMPTYEALLALRPDLSRLRYGIVALGDTTYHQTFCGAGRSLDEILAAFGAARIGTRCEIDASSQPFADEEAVGWLGYWMLVL